MLQSKAICLLNIGTHIPYTNHEMWLSQTSGTHYINPRPIKSNADDIIKYKLIVKKRDQTCG